MDDLESTIERYISKNNERFQRYNSWNHCFEAFGCLKDLKLLSLHLGFYLASWGMYRGSGGLLQKDYLIHSQAVSIIFSYEQLRCAPEHEIYCSSVPEILALIGELQEYYRRIDFETLNGSTKQISATDTLISKIILGTLGCLPALDRFFVKGVRTSGLDFKNLEEKSLVQLFEFTEKNRKELIEIQNKHPEYTKMKLVDMCFWQIGYDFSKPRNGIINKSSL